MEPTPSDDEREAILAALRNLFDGGRDRAEGWAATALLEALEDGDVDP